MLDLVSFQNSFLLRWAELLMDPEHAEWKKSALRAFLPVGGRSAFYSNLNVKEFKGMNLIKKIRLFCAAPPEFIIGPILTILGFK